MNRSVNPAASSPQQDGRNRQNAYRVAYVTRATFVSGAERSLQTTLQLLPTVGLEAVLICQPGSPLIAWCLEKGIRYACVPLADRDRWHPVRWLISVALMTRVLRRERVDLIHANQVWAFAAAGTAGRLLRLPRVCHMRDEVPSEAVRWWCKSGVEAVIAISRHIQEMVSPAWPDKEHRPRIMTMLNPVSPVLPDPDGEAQSQARRHFGLNQECPTLGFVGQIVPTKGLLHLLDALSRLPSTVKWQLLVAGRDPTPGQAHERECADYSAAKGFGGRVTFAGFLDDVTPFYRAIDFAVVPSLAEPLGRIPLEAGVHGKPSVAFAAGGLTEIIRDHDTGWLLPVGDVDQLARTLARLIEEPQRVEQAGQAARIWVSEMCDPARYIQRLKELYVDLVLAGQKA